MPVHVFFYFILHYFGDVHMLLYTFSFIYFTLFLVVYTCFIVYGFFLVGNSATSNNESIPFDRCGERNGF